MSPASQQNHCPPPTRSSAHQDELQKERESYPDHTTRKETLERDTMIEEDEKRSGEGHWRGVSGPHSKHLDSFHPSSRASASFTISPCSRPCTQHTRSTLFSSNAPAPPSPQPSTQSISPRTYTHTRHKTSKRHLSAILHVHEWARTTKPRRIEECHHRRALCSTPIQ